MSDTNAQEPTMEEILASIRRIISEDDPPAAADPAPPEPTPTLVAPPAPLTVHQASTPPQASATPASPKAPPPPEDDVLELTEPLNSEPPAPPKAAPHKETLGDLEVFSASPTLPPPAPRAPSAAAFAEEPLIGSYAAEQSASHFESLARSVTMPKEGRTLEDVVRELLKPMLRDWLDTNLSVIVEARVQAEVERISRRQDY